LDFEQLRGRDAETLRFGFEQDGVDLQIEFTPTHLDDLPLQVRDALADFGRDVCTRDARVADGCEYFGERPGLAAALLRRVCLTLRGRGRSLRRGLCGRRRRLRRDGRDERRE